MDVFFLKWSLVVVRITVFHLENFYQGLVCHLRVHVRHILAKSTSCHGYVEYDIVHVINVTISRAWGEA